MWVQMPRCVYHTENTCLCDWGAEHHSCKRFLLVSAPWPSTRGVWSLTLYDQVQNLVMAFCIKSKGTSYCLLCRGTWLYCAIEKDYVFRGHFWHEIQTMELFVSHLNQQWEEVAERVQSHVLWQAPFSLCWALCSVPVLHHGPGFGTAWSSAWALQ